VPPCVRVETAIPIGAVPVGKELGGGSVLALILGSMFRKKPIVAFALNVFVVALAARYLVDRILY
jgi:hypothetical protein